MGNGQSARNNFEWTLTGVHKPLLSSPHDIIKRDDTFWVTDKSYHQIQVLDKDLKPSNKFSPDDLYTSDMLKFDPYAITYTGETFLVTDLANHCVVEFRGFRAIKVFGREQLSQPTGIAVNTSRKEIYVADFGNDCIFVFDQKSEEHPCKHTIGERGTGKGKLNKPWFMAINSKGHLLVAEARNHRVQVFDPETKESIQIIDVKYKGWTWNCRGIALDEDDNIFISVCWALMQRFVETVVVYSSTGKFLGNFGNGFHYVRGLTVARRENVTTAYVVDGENHSICTYKILQKERSCTKSDSPKSTPKKV